MAIFLALLATAILAGLAVFQFALTCGAPLGRFAWGGKHEVLPSNLRVWSVASILLYAIFAMFILSAASVVSIIPEGSLLRNGMIVFSGYFVLGTVVNLISPSKPERLVMTPVAAVLAVTFLGVAFGV